MRQNEAFLPSVVFVRNFVTVNRKISYKDRYINIALDAGLRNKKASGQQVGEGSVAHSDRGPLSLS